MGGMGLGDGNFSVTPLVKVDFFFPPGIRSSKEQSRLLTVEGARILIIALPLLLEKDAGDGEQVSFYN